MPLSSRFAIRAYALASSTAPANDLGTGTAAQVLIDQVTDFALTDGTGVGSANVVFSDTRTLAASANEDLDLSGTALQDALGVNLGLARVKGIYIAAAAGNTNNVVVGAAAATQWLSLIGTATGTIILRPGAKFLAVAGPGDATGYTVGAGATDLLRIANSGAGTSVTYDIIVVGANA